MIKKFFIIIIFVLLQTNINASSFKPIIEGKKDAKIRLIIYESLTCSHCADFHNEVYPKLKKEFIDTGVINIEFRSFPLDMAALNASKLAHCNNDGKADLLHFLYLLYYLKCLDRNDLHVHEKDIYNKFYCYLIKIQLVFLDKIDLEAIETSQNNRHLWEITMGPL